MINKIKFIGLFFIVLLAIFICYGIFFAVIAYFFIIKLLAIAAIIASIFYLFIKIRKKDLEL